MIALGAAPLGAAPVGAPLPSNQIAGRVAPLLREASLDTLEARDGGVVVPRAQKNGETFATAVGDEALRVLAVAVAEPPLQEATLL